MDHYTTGLRLRSQHSKSEVDVSVVFPCLNEAESVGLCIAEAFDALKFAGYRAEVVVVDNGSTDGSAQIASEYGAHVVVEQTRGYGAALRAGIAAATGTVVVMADADQTYELSWIPKMVALVLDDKADLVIGSRFDGRRKSSMPLLHRYLGTPVLTYLVGKASAGAKVRDSQSGFRAFRRDKIVNLGLTSSGMEFASELLIRAARAELRISEIPTRYRERVGHSKLNPLADGWRHLYLIFLLAPHLLLVGPGAALLALGTALTLASVVAPMGVIVGSLRWQPVFFSSICLVLGSQTALAGMVLSYRSSIVSKEVRRRFAFVGDPGFPPACIRGGLLALFAGLALDVLLFVWWVLGKEPYGNALGLAGLAQSLLMVGGSLSAFGLITRLYGQR